MPRPWPIKGEPTTNPYCDFAAWEEWADELLQLDLDSTIDRIMLYVAMCDLCDQPTALAASEANP